LGFFLLVLVRAGKKKSDSLRKNCRGGILEIIGGKRKENDTGYPRKGKSPQRGNRRIGEGGKERLQIKKNRTEIREWGAASACGNAIRVFILRRGESH